MGAKKAGGMGGAQKVKKDFAEIEREAELADQVIYKTNYVPIYIVSQSRFLQRVSHISRGWNFVFGTSQILPLTQPALKKHGSLLKMSKATQKYSCHCFYQGNV